MKELPPGKGEKPNSGPKVIWDTAQAVQERLASKYGNGKAGLAAFYKIRKLLEPYWKHEPRVAHPLTGMLLIASQRNYDRLIHLAAKLEEFAQIPEAGFVWERLGVAREYLGAIFEVDFTLRLTHAGIVSRITHSRGNRIADVSSQFNSHDAKIEITSHRDEDQLYALKAFMSLQDAATRGGAILGGTVDRIPRSKAQIAELCTRIEETARQAKLLGKTVSLNLPGKAFHLTPQNSELTVPEEFRELEAGTSPQKRDKLYDTIREKAQKYASAETLIIVIYDWAAYPTKETLKSYLNLKIPSLLEKFQNLGCVVLICPAFEKLNSIRIDRPSLSYLEHSPKVPLEGRSERIVVWKNQNYRDRSISESVIKSLTDSKPIVTPWLHVPNET